MVEHHSRNSRQDKRVHVYHLSETPSSILNPFDPHLKWYNNCSHILLTNTYTYEFVYYIYISIYLSIGFKTGSLPSCCIWPSTCINQYCVKRHYFIWILLKRFSMRESPAPPPPFPFKTYLDLIIHIIKKINIKIFSGSKYICTLTILRAKSLQKIIQHIKVLSCQLLNPQPRTPPSPPPPPSTHLLIYLFLSFFSSVSRFVAVKNKYSVFRIPRNIYTSSVFCYDEHKKNFDIKFSMKRHEMV